MFHAGELQNITVTVHSKSVCAAINLICCLQFLNLDWSAIASGFVCSIKAPPNLPGASASASASPVPSPKNRPVALPAHAAVPQAIL